MVGKLRVGSLHHVGGTDARLEDQRDLHPFLALLIVFCAAAAIWLQLPIPLRSDLLAIGWPILGVITVLQTAWMLLKVMRRYRGFKA